MNRTRKRTLSAAAAALMVFATACSRLDVVGKGSVTSFDAVLKVVPEQVEAHEGNGGWSLSTPDGTARFVWSGDWSKSPRYDVMLQFDAAPFLEAGLDPEKLPEQFGYDGEALEVGTKLKAASDEADSTPLAAYERIVRTNRESIGYHMAMDHYGVSLGGGNMFEWAKDMSVNDKDMVFVLDPQPFIDAGVDPNEVEGWAFAKVEIMDDRGRTVEVDKLLKPFDLQ